MTSVRNLLLAFGLIAINNKSLERACEICVEVNHSHASKFLWTIYCVDSCKYDVSKKL